MNSKSPYHVLLASYTWAKHADRHGAMSDNEVINECLRDLAKIHQQTYEFVRLQFHSGVVQRWGTDPSTLTGFAYLDPFQYQEFEDVLKAREGRFIVAGEYTATPHGWIHAALKSGIRAALEVHTLAQSTLI